MKIWCLQKHACGGDTEFYTYQFTKSTTNSKIYVLCKKKKEKTLNKKSEKIKGTQIV